MINLHLTNDNDSKFVFSNRDHNECSHLKLSHDSSVGVFIQANQDYKIGDIIHQTIVKYAISIGSKANYICSNCFQITNKMKIFPNCSHYSFCSTECMSCFEDYIEQYNMIINELHSYYNDVKNDANNKSWLHMSLLVLKIIYDVLHKNDDNNTQTSHHNYDIFQLEHHPNLHIPEIALATESFLSIYSRYTSPDLRHVSRLLTINRLNVTKNPLFTLIYTLYRILYFNTHTLHVANLSDTSIFLIHPIYARINHSCHPNTLLQIALTKKGHSDPTLPPPTTGLTMYTKAIADICIDEQITISYLSNLCLPYTNRIQLLELSYHFICTCRRCEIERVLCNTIDNNNNSNNGRIKAYVDNDEDIRVVLAAHTQYLAYMSKASNNNISTTSPTQPQYQQSASYPLSTDYKASIELLISILRGLDRLLLTHSPDPSFPDHSFPPADSVPTTETTTTLIHHIQYTVYSQYKQHVFIYACHDLAMALIPTNQAIYTSNFVSHILPNSSNRDESDYIRLLCCTLVVKCWNMTGNRYHTQCLQYILLGISTYHPTATTAKNIATTTTTTTTTTKTTTTATTTTGDTTSNTTSTGSATYSTSIYATKALVSWLVEEGLQLITVLNMSTLPLPVRPILQKSTALNNSNDHASIDNTTSSSNSISGSTYESIYLKLLSIQNMLR